MEMDRQVLYWFSGKDRAEQNETMRVLCLLGGRQKLQKLLVLFILYIFGWLQPNREVLISGFPACLSSPSSYLR